MKSLRDGARMKSECLSTDGMKFKIENLGPILEAELELGNLTIIAGRNNTGKTHVAHALFGFLKKIDSWISDYCSPKILEKYFYDIGVGSIQGAIHEALESGEYRIMVKNEAVEMFRKNLLEGAIRSYSKKGLKEVFNYGNGLYHGSSIEMNSGALPPIGPCL